MAFTKVATVADIAPGKGKQVEVNGRKIALFHDGEKVYALDDTCTHRGGPLSEGTCAQGRVVCPWHGANFDLATGANLSPPAPKGVQAFAVQVVGDEVQVDI